MQNPVVFQLDEQWPHGERENEVERKGVGMTEANGNEEIGNEEIGDEEIGCTEEDLEVIDQERAVSIEAVAAPVAGPNVPMGFNLRGPKVKLRQIARTVRRTSDGVDVEVEWEYSWAPGLQQAEGLSVEEVARVVGGILNHSNGWVRAGIWFPRVPIDQAQGVIRYVPRGQTRCNKRTPTAVGCTIRGFLPGKRDLIELVVPKFGEHKGLLHEVAHAFAGAKHNRDTRYSGIMGNSPKGIWPTENDVQSVKRWLGGGGH